MSTTYASAGVDIDAATRFVDMIKERITAAWPEAGGEIGGFAGGGPIPAGAKRFKGGIDGTGTKAILAALTGNLGGIGQDAVAMAVVDAYIETGTLVSTVWDVLDVASLKPDVHIEVIKSII
jgi:phosphoribosylaminoimidazole (AIR) synthetase